MIFNYKLEPGRYLKKQGDVEVNEEPQVTIITPFYNTKKELIQGTANSILNQTYPFFEWLIIDDGSTDNQSLKDLDEIGKLDNRIKIIHKQNEGLAQTRDFGAKQACSSSKYLLFIDDDDQISNTFVECAYWTLETNVDATWAYSDSIGFGAQEYIWRKWYNPIRQKKENRLISINFIRKKDFFEAGGYELKEKSVYEDWNFWLKLIAKEKFPVRMSSIDLWYRRKEQTNGELARARANNERAMNIIENTANTINNVKNGIQYPKQDYNWDVLLEEVENIKTPILKNNDKIKILMIIPWMVTGGADKFNLDLVKKMDKEKFEFIIVSTQPSTNNLKQQFQEHAIVYDLTSFLDRKYWIAFLNYLIKKNKINIVFNTCSQFGYNCLPYIKSKNPKMPIIDYVHMEEWYWRNGGYSRDSYAFSEVIDKTLVCNKASESILINHFKRKREDVDTIYIGVDEEQFNPEDYSKNEILEKLNINAENKYIISYICRIATQKRPYLMLEIIKKLKEYRDDFVVVVAGDGPLLNKIKNKAKKQKLSGNIYFLGNYANTQEIYAISDLTLNCSIKEGVALTSYESLSMDVPVISSDVGGQKELINSEVGKIVSCYQSEDEIENFIYSEEEIFEYVNAIQEMLSDIQKYKGLCRNRILDKFTIKNMISNMEKIFLQAVREPKKEKIENGLNLSKCTNLTKEYITQYMMCSEKEYKWLALQFNKNNVDRDFEFDAEEKYAYYEQTLEYKIKHPIVVILRKIGIYDFCKKIIGKE